MQGRELLGKAAPTLTFALGFGLSASLTFGLLALVGNAIFSRSTPIAVRVVVALLALGLAFVDFRGSRRGSCFAPGPRRQTSRVLRHMLPAPLTTLIWGIDAGCALSTYRATVGSWVLVIVSLAGLGSPWIGVAYGCGFLTPLLFSLWGGRKSFIDDTADRIRDTLDSVGVRHIRKVAWALIIAIVTLVSLGVSGAVVQ